MVVDGESVPVTVRADYLVVRAGRRYVAEVKTGSTAPSAHHVATRRQLLEYRHAFEVDGVLLVDPEEDSVSEVSFPGGPAAQSPSRLLRLRWILVGAAVGIIATVLSARWIR
jgi:hypothetical protein